MLDHFNASHNTQSLADHSLNVANDASIVWMLIIVLVPHFFYMPIALSGLMAIVLILWQMLIVKYGHYRFAQKRWLQYAVVSLGLLMIFLHHHTFLGVEAGCATLALILLGKAFELKHYRDAIIEFNFALFVVASLFLYGQSIALAVAAVCGVLSCFYGMYQLQRFDHAFEDVSLQIPNNRQLRLHTFKIVAKLLLIATPLMVILFLFFPRFPPLWSIPTTNTQAQTGVNDEMSPGDIAQLSQSSALAFRVIFAAPQYMPNKADLYWRAMTLDHFDGIKWTQQRTNTTIISLAASQYKQLEGIPEAYHLPQGYSSFQQIEYQMILEPHQHNWSYALDYSIAAAPLQLKSDFSIQLPSTLTQRRQLNLHLLLPNPITDPKISASEQQYYLQRPVQANPKSLAFAKQLFTQSSQNPQRYAQSILDWIRKENFSYTLSPPTLHGDRIDDFLFNTRSGFCEHYASAFVNLMRMAGIPARVVVGYQGGQAAPDDQSWEVRQLDAHAWTEVWFADQGWVRIDPTAAIAPERIQQGMQNFSSQNPNFYSNSTLSQWHSHWLTQAKIWSDYLNYQWQNKVIGFDQDKQKNWLKRLSIAELGQQIIILVLLILVVVIAVVWWISKQQQTLSKLDRALFHLSKRLSAIQLQRQDHEPVLSWFKRISLYTDHDVKLQHIQQLYTQHTYIQPLSATDMKKLIELLGKYTINAKIK